jgi:hypothetical protein
VRHSVRRLFGGGDLVDRSAQVVADRRRSVEQDDSVLGEQEPDW